MDINSELIKILENQKITTVFQPIVNLKTTEIIGYEALSRGPINSSLHLPGELFKAAENCNKIWQLESLCRTKAIVKYSGLCKDKYLFLNVDSRIFKDEKFKEGFTKEFLEKHNMSPDSIIFEITQKTALEDYNSFKVALNNYVNQGYKIAIDDTGVSYSGLKTLIEAKPHFIKIDMDLVRNIDKDIFKQAIMKAFVSLSIATNMKLIAAGIETKEELSTLINLGVYAGQGIFLLKPGDEFLGLSEDMKHLLMKLNRPVKVKNNDIKTYIGAIARRDIAFPISTLSKDLKSFFHRENIIMGACIVENGQPVGLVMRHSLDSVLATQYGISVFSKRPVSLVMETTPLIVDYYTLVSDVSRFAMERAPEQIYDYVIVTKDSKYYGLVSIKNLLQHATTLEKNYAKELNPLTGLPGNSIIENTIRGILEYNYEVCLLYLDLDNFKVYNDNYGFENGDKILKYSANLIQTKVRAQFPVNSFVGHIGGDDFVCMIKTSYESCQVFCREIIEDFNKEVLQFFNKKDKSNGYIEAFDRKGNKDIFKLTSVSIAGFYGNLKNFKTPEEVAKSISKIKKDVKKSGGNNFKIISINKSQKITPNFK